MAIQSAQNAEPEPPHPVLKAILLCERIIAEVGTTKITLVGTLGRLTSSQFPFDYRRGLELYVQITDVAGAYAMRMEVIRLEDERTIAEGETVSVIADRMDAYDVGFELPSIPFERPGRYDFRVFANSRFIASAVLLVERAA
ncbi:MAG: hypothetical protein FJZ38_23320 [Candidatus Rokubacteria bacterium]|nr:hypothetical protein [Candidatus Rokubacteria bacterium]